MPLPIRTLRTAVAGACLLTAAACGGGASAGGSLVTFAADHRKVAPDLSGATLGDKAFSLAANRGHVVVVNYWASWCDPCRDEAPQLDRLATDFQPQDVVFIGVSFHGDDKTAARSFLTTHQVPYDSLFDPDSKSVLQFRGKVTIAAPPITMVIDKQGRIADVIDGEVIYSELRDAINRATAEAA